MGGSGRTGGGGITIGARTASSFGRMRNRAGGLATNVERARANYRRMDAGLNARGGRGAAAEARRNRRRARPRRR